MALSKSQERVERSIYHAIREVLVAEGYTPNIMNTGLFGVPPYTSANQTAWDNALVAIATAKGFAVEVFGHSVTKSLKKVPRIVIIPRRTMPGDIGAPDKPYYFENPENPNELLSMSIPPESSHFYYDIHLVSGSAAQDRVLNAVLSKALGRRKYIKYYDQTTDLFFIRQGTYYDLPDPVEGQEEKVFSYEVPDIYEVDDVSIPVTIIQEITAEVIALGLSGGVDINGNPTGDYIQDGSVVTDLNGIKYN